MNKLQTKVNNLFYDYKQKNDFLPQYVITTIRWKDNKELMSDLIFAFDNKNSHYIDDEIFFYVDYEQFMSMIPPLDFTLDDFDNDVNSWQDELNKYDTEEDNEYYFTSKEDFDIVDVSYFE